MGGSPSEEAAPDKHVAVEFLSLADAARSLGLKPGSLTQQVRAGHLSAVRVGHRNVTTQAWLDEYQVLHSSGQGRASAYAPGPARQFATRFTALRRWTGPLYVDLAVDMAIDVAVECRVHSRQSLSRSELCEIVDAHFQKVLPRGSSVQCRSAAAARTLEVAFADSDERWRRLDDLLRAAALDPAAAECQWQTHANRLDESNRKNRTKLGRNWDQAVAMFMAGEILSNVPRAQWYKWQGYIRMAMHLRGCSLPADRLQAEVWIADVVNRALKAVERPSRRARRLRL